MAETNTMPQRREAVGVFVTTEAVDRAVEALRESGFAKESVGLLTADRSIEAAPPAGVESRDTVPETSTHAWLGGISMAGTTALGATAVASAAVLGGALVAAVAGAAAVGAVGAAMAGVIHQGDAAYLEEQIDEGRVLVFVRTIDRAHERRAQRILAEHGAVDVRMLTVDAPPAQERSEP